MELEGLNNAWLSPLGRFVTEAEDFFADGYAWHEELALFILKDLWHLETHWDAFEKVHKKFNNTATEELENKGWIRLHGFGGLEAKWILPCSYKLTKRQERSVLDWCLTNKKNYDDSFAK